MEKSKKSSSNNLPNSKAQNTLLSVLEVSKKLSVEHYNNGFSATALQQNLLTPISITNVSAVNTPGTSGGLKIPTDILDDLASRFIINIPDKERADMIRICFQIELAHWFYLDFMLPNSQNSTNDNVKKLPPCGIKQFAWQIFYHVPFLRSHQLMVDKILEEWKQYKTSVPTHGAILISENENSEHQVLLVQSYWSKCSWGFPKGKINENEDQVKCAIREVDEETGYDITNLINPNEYIELVINMQYTRLYLVTGVPQKTVFEPKTRNEIKCCKWFSVESLPTNKNESKLYNGNSFFMIFPFIKRLKRWLAEKRIGIDSAERLRINTAGGHHSPKTFTYNTPETNTAQRRQRNKSQGDISSSTPVPSSNQKLRYNVKSAVAKSPFLDVSISSILDVSHSGRGQNWTNTPPPAPMGNTGKINKIKRKLSYDAGVGDDRVNKNYAALKNRSKPSKSVDVNHTKFEFDQKVTNVMVNFQFNRLAIIVAMKS